MRRGQPPIVTPMPGARPGNVLRWEDTMKKTYIQPKLTDLGSVRELTLGSSSGLKFDQSLSAVVGAPANHNIFS
jgi:hypothetical protein